MLSTEQTDRLRHWFDDRGVVSPSVNYALFDRSGLLFHHGVGWYDDSGRPPLRDTVYRIGSMSKSFCVASLLAIRDAGGLALHDPVSTYVPEFPDHVDRHGRETVVTLEMLLSNCSGLPEDNAWADYHLGISRADLLALLGRGLNYSSWPGTEYQYSNLGFGVLGLVVENVTGEDYLSYARRTLLEPLGLQATQFDAADYPDGGAGAGLAHGYQTHDQGESWFARPFVPQGAFACAGSMFSTLPDIARWGGWLSSAFVGEDDDPGEEQVLSRAARRLMQRSRTPMHTFDRREQPHLGNVGYGMGLFVEHDERFGAIAQHAGGLPGFSSIMRWHCASGIGCIVFTNTNDTNPGRYAAEMLREVLVDLDVPARTVHLWPATVEAAEAVERVIRESRPLHDLEPLVSPNVFTDLPADLRDARLRQLLADAGGLDPQGLAAPLTERLESAVSAAQLCWRIPAASGGLECRIEMTETEPSMIQRIDLRAADGDTDGPGDVTRFYRPVAGPPAGRQG